MTPFVVGHVLGQGPIQRMRSITMQGRQNREHDGTEQRTF
jgi:hypothetical protein